MPKKKLTEPEVVKTRYKVNFNFTTVRGNLFSAKKGDICVDSTLTIEKLGEVKDELRSICLSEILKKKPKWNIFNFIITSIEPA